LELYLGVDGGQSSTKAVIGDATGRILGRGTAGPCNHVSASEARAKFSRTILECVGNARAAAGLGHDVHFRAACFGMSGGPEDKDAILREIIVAEQWLVTHDGLIALSGAVAGADGIVAIGGTGSIAFGRRGDRTMRAGGWGYIFGDEGGAFWIVKEAVRAAVRLQEGWGPTTRLLEMLLQATGVRTANEVLHLFYTPEWPRSRVARLSAEVSRVAQAGDETAVSILKNAGRQLAQFVAAIHSTLWHPGETAHASYIGGVFRSPEVLQSFERALENVVVREPIWGADAGALIEAYRIAGISATLREA